MATVYTFLIVFLVVVASILSKYMSRNNTINSVIRSLKDEMNVDYSGSIKDNYILFKDKILLDNPAVVARDNISGILTLDTTGSIYITKSDSKNVYYYAGNTKNNWVLFGGYYWKIIRTNEDGGVRLLYFGTSPTTTNASIGSSAFNSTNNNSIYSGYMFGTTGSLANNRTNENNSAIKTMIDSWYMTNICGATSVSKDDSTCTKVDVDNVRLHDYISKTAIYCNDRSGGSYSATSMQFASYKRLTPATPKPTYQCGEDGNKNLYSDANNADKFSVSTTNGGNGDLTYPVALMTADEIVFAGVPPYATSNSPNLWYYQNASGGSSTGSTAWWTMSPSQNTGKQHVWNIGGSSYPSRLYDDQVQYSRAVRPVISLKGCAMWKEGNGTSDSPYQIKINSSCASAEN